MTHAVLWGSQQMAPRQIPDNFFFVSNYLILYCHIFFLMNHVFSNSFFNSLPRLFNYDARSFVG